MYVGSLKTELAPCENCLSSLFLRRREKYKFRILISRSQRKGGTFQIRKSIASHYLPTIICLPFFVVICMLLLFFFFGRVIQLFD